MFAHLEAGMAAGTNGSAGPGPGGADNHTDHKGRQVTQNSCLYNHC